MGYGAHEVRESCDATLWKSIGKEWVDGDLFFRRTFFLGNVSRVRFWKGRWCEEDPICLVFPAFFNLAHPKDAWTSEMWPSWEEEEE